jgi:hypothetical protein
MPYSRLISYWKQSEAESNFDQLMEEKEVFTVSNIYPSKTRICLKLELRTARFIVVSNLGKTEAAVMGIFVLMSKSRIPTHLV